MKRTFSPKLAIAEASRAGIVNFDEGPSGADADISGMTRGTDAKRSLTSSPAIDAFRAHAVVSELREILTEVQDLLALAQASSSTPEHSGRLLGTLLVMRGFLVQSELDYALAQQATTGKRLGEVVVDLGFVSEDVIVELVAEQHRIEVFDPEVNTVDVDIALRLSPADARRLSAVPIVQTRGTVVVAVADPTQPDLVGELVKRLHVPVRLCATTNVTIADLIARVYGAGRCRRHPSSPTTR